MNYYKIYTYFYFIKYNKGIKELNVTLSLIKFDISLIAAMLFLDRSK